MPPDILQAEADVHLVDAVAKDEPLQPDEPAVRKAAELIQRAERPLIYAGGGVVAGNASDHAVTSRASSRAAA